MNFKTAWCKFVEVTYPHLPSYIRNKLHLEMADTIEAVLMRLFNHVMTECEITEEGRYKNPYGVMEPVCINDIPFSKDIFITMDTYNEEGIYTPETKCNGYITGLVSARANLPMYKLHVDVGGHILKYTFIAQDPDKTSHNNDLCLWSRESREGVLRMILLSEDRLGVTAHIVQNPGLEAEFIIQK